MCIFELEKSSRHREKRKVTGPELNPTTFLL